MISRKSYSQLKVWDKSMIILKLVYQLVNGFPKEEKFVLNSQMKRSAISVLSNIAEGNSRLSAKEKARFFEIAYGSAVELQAQLNISFELGFIKQTVYSKVDEKLFEVIIMLNGLYQSQKRITSLK